MKGEQADKEFQTAYVKVEDSQTLINIPISSGKPEIPETLISKWQTIIDLCAKILEVPSGLITKLTTEHLVILAASNTKGNPYSRDDKDSLGIGMFCESVAGQRENMEVPDIEDSEYWRNNPHAGLGMKSYIGLPIQWEDGELFGTFCFLDNKAHAYSQTYKELLERFKEVIETDLKNLILQELLRKQLKDGELRLREIHHRIKNQFNILSSYIGLQVRTISDENAQQLLNEIKHRVMVLSLIHEDLYQSETLNSPGLDIYLPRLCSYIVNDFCCNDVRLHFSLENIHAPMETEISTGLIVTELLTNSLKHAFSKDQSDKLISLSIQRLDEKHISLVYRDNGKGLPEGFDHENCNSLGIRILIAICSQLRGSMEVKNDSGAVFSFRLEM